MAKIPICRRQILTAGLVLGTGSFLRAKEHQDAAPPRPGDLLVKGSDKTATPLTPADIKPGARPVMAWPLDPSDKTIRSASRLNRVLLVRLDPDKVLAFSAICTHAGCEVTDLVDQHLFCPCHESTFDPLNQGKVIDGPATKALPALPLKVEDGKLVVAGPFTAPITFEVQ